MWNNAPMSILKTSVERFSQKLFRVSGRAIYRVTGGDRVAYFHGQCTNEVKKLPVGESLYAVLCDAKGKILSDIHIARFSDELLIDLPVEVEEKIIARLQRYIIVSDVQIEPVEGLSLWHFIGEKLPEKASGENVLQAACSRFRVKGHDFFFSDGRTTPAKSELDEIQTDTLYVLTAKPRWNRELDENRLPQEVGLENFGLSYSKGCYTGQEVIARIKSIGHVNRKLCVLRGKDSGEAFSPLIELTDEGGSVAGKITSLAPQAHEGQRFALALVHRNFLREGFLLNSGQYQWSILQTL